MNVRASRLKLLLVRLYATLALIYAAAVLQRETTRANWRMFKATMRGVWGQW